MISTGSMAPTLLGYHRQATCPDCGYAFARGSVPQRLRLATAETANTAALDDRPDAVHCPLCQARFETTAFRTEGDQLLVHKHAFDARLPRRWEVIVFRSGGSGEAFIKRTAGLPGETIRIRGGDVYADGRLCRKDPLTQDAMRLPVALVDRSQDRTDDGFRVAERWAFEPGWSADGPAGRTVLRHTGERSAVRYRHRVREGDHRTSVRVDWPGEPPRSRRLVYSDGELHCRGAMPNAIRDRLLQQSDDPAVRAAIVDLAKRSQLSPVVDVCGYNRPAASTAIVRDLLVEGRAKFEPDADEPPELRVTLLYGRQPFTMTLRPGEVTVETLDERGDPVMLDAAALRPSRSRRWSLSVIDRQVAVTLDGALPFAPLPFGETKLTRSWSREPLTIDAAGAVSVSRLGLWRDVSVTPPDADSPLLGDGLTLGPDELFVLGDNSPVSVDSRRWADPTVSRNSLIGKPLVVHLPSRQVEVPYVGPVRVPHLSRIRPVR